MAAIILAVASLVGEGDGSKTSVEASTNGITELGVTQSVRDAAGLPGGYCTDRACDTGAVQASGDGDQGDEHQQPAGVRDMPPVHGAGVDGLGVNDATVIPPDVCCHPEPTATPAHTHTPVGEHGAGTVHGFVTHYGTSYNGQPLGCPGYGLYSSDNPTIAASAYDLATGARPYQCGEQLEVCGDNACAVVVVQDACPGCGWNHLDLSESGKVIVCGELGDNCAVSIRRLW